MTDLEHEPDVPRIRVGCAGLPPRMSRERYWQELSFLESDITYRSPPRRAAIRGWREAAPEGASFSLLAWQAITHRPGKQGYAHKGRPLTPSELAETGGLRDTPMVRTAVEAMKEAAEAVSAEAIVFRTPAGFAPSAKNRDAMKHFFEELAPPGAFGAAVRVWQPEGLWRPDEAIRAATDLDLLLACDPLARDPLEEQAPVLANELPRDAAYFRITGLGSSNSQLDTGDLEELTEFLAEFERAWVVFANVAKFADARRFARSIGASGSAEEG